MVFLKMETTHQLNFPRQLTDAIGDGVLATMPFVKVRETATGYFDGCFSEDMIPPGGAFKGTDQYGRVYVTFAVYNPRFADLVKENWLCRYSKTALFTIFQRYDDDGKFCHRWCDDIPTNDSRFRYSCVMNSEKYQAVREIFQGLHVDLRLGVSPVATATD